MDAKRALEDANGDAAKAKAILREKGIAAAAKRAERETSNGVVESYIHGGGRVGVIVEVNCETDFVARNERFQSLVRDIAMHVAASAPLAVTVDDLPAAEVERERGVQRELVRNEGKPEAMWDRIVDGRMRKWYQEKALLEQAFVKAPETTVGQLVQQVAAETGENIVIRRFARFALGE